MKTSAFIISLVVFCILNSVAVVVADEEVHVCPPCECTSKTLQNLQLSLDSCRRVSEMNEKVLKMYEKNNQMLTKSFTMSTEDDDRSKEDRNNLLAMVNDLQSKLEIAARKESKFEDQKEDLLTKIEALEAELKAVSLLTSNKTASE